MKFTYGEIGGRGRGAAKPYDRIARAEGEGDGAKGEGDGGRLVEGRRLAQRLGIVEGKGDGGREGRRKVSVNQRTYVHLRYHHFPPSLPPSLLPSLPPRVQGILTKGWDQVGNETVPYRPAGLPICR